MSHFHTLHLLLVEQFVKQTVHQMDMSVEQWREADFNSLARDVSRPPRQDPAQVDLQPPEGCVPHQAHALSDDRTPVSAAELPGPQA